MTLRKVSVGWLVSLALSIAVVCSSACTAILGGFDFNGKPTTDSGGGGGAGGGTASSSSSGGGTGGDTAGCNSNADCTDPKLPVCSPNHTCVAAGCMNDVQDTDESDVDCGGAECTKCGYNKKCKSNTDCFGGSCQNGSCAATCSDGEQNGGETDLDCGGPVCTKCAVGKACVTTGDCQTASNGSVACVGGKCTLSCPAGWDDCLGVGDCTTDLNTTAAHCGACDTACSAHCVAGTCNDPIAVAAGSDFTCAILGDASVWCWGDNSVGQLGDNSQVDSAVPKPITLPGAASAIAGGGAHACAVVGADVWCWGLNGWGELGVGDTIQHAGAQKAPTGVAMKRVAAGFRHTCAVSMGDSVFCWGENDSGQVGNGPGMNALTPTEVVTGAFDVTAGRAHTCALKTDNTVACWGNGMSGQLGDGASHSTNTPGPSIAGLTGVLQVASGPGASHTCAIGNGGAFCWGENGSGQLGNGMKGAPVLSPMTALPLTFADHVAVGAVFSGAITNTGLFMWGAGGPLGDGTPNQSLTPEQINLADVTSLTAGDWHACAVTKDHKLYCWGKNDHGQVGNNAMSSSFVVSPTPVVWP